MNTVVLSKLHDSLINLAITPLDANNTPSVTSFGLEISDGVVVPVKITRKLVRKGTGVCEAVHLEITSADLLGPGDEIIIRALDPFDHYVSDDFCLYRGTPLWGVTDTVDSDARVLPLRLLLEGKEAPPKPKAEPTEAKASEKTA